MSVKLFQVDAFTATPFTGNPAAVCLLDAARDTGWMANVAEELNLPDTAFLQRAPDGFRLRWFTPAMEVDLCGHATLASAHILWEEGLVAERLDARFHTRSGLLTARKRDGWIELDFPATPARSVEAPRDLLEALGVAPEFVGTNDMDHLVLLRVEADVRVLAPDMRRMTRVGGRGVIVTAPADDPELDFVSRFFAPAAGVDEDPVTGSAHCCLGPFWGERLGKTELRAYQASARGGHLRVTLAGDRVRIAGQAVTVSRGDLVV